MIATLRRNLADTEQDSEIERFNRAQKRVRFE